VVDGPVVDGPVVDGPVVDGPVVDGPVVDGPVVADPVARCGSGGARSAPVPLASWCSVAVLPSCPPRRPGSAPPGARVQPDPFTTTLKIFARYWFGWPT
jgi:hypothetical protein